METQVQNNFRVDEDVLLQDYSDTTQGDEPEYELPDEDEEQEHWLNHQDQPKVKPATAEIPSYTKDDEPVIKMPGIAADQGPETAAEDDVKPEFKNTSSALRSGVRATIGTLDFTLKRVFAALAADEPGKWGMTDSEKKEFEDMWLPVAEMYKPKINPLHLALFATLAFLFVKGYVALKQGQAKRKIQAAVNAYQPGPGAAASPVPAERKPVTYDEIERSRFDIHSTTGAFAYARNGRDYYPVGNPDAEMPDITNKEVFTRIVNKNGRAKVMRTYNLTEEFYNAHYIEDLA